MTFLRFCVGRVDAVSDEGLRVLVFGLARGRDLFSEAEEGGGMSEDEVEDEEGLEVEPGTREGSGPLPGTRKDDEEDAGVRCGICARGAAGLGRGGGGIIVEAVEVLKEKGCRCFCFS